MTHEFIFQTGEWLGEGQITFSKSPAKLKFYTKWVATPLTHGLIKVQQQVEMIERRENLRNEFVFSQLQPASFSVDLSGEEIIPMQGTGVIDSRTIAWEFRNNPEIEGFEVYELQDNGQYTMHAEFISSENYRTMINGRIWKKL